MPALAAANPRLAEHARIKRATRAAQRATDLLDERTLDQVEAMYQRAAAELRERIAAHRGGDGNLGLAELQAILAQVTDRLRALAVERDRLLGIALDQAATNGVDAFRDSAALDTLALARIHDEAVTAVRSFIAADGLQLSDRLWRLDRGAREKITGAIEQAIIQGHGAAQAAREFIAQGRPVPEDVREKMDDADAEATARAAGNLLVRGEGNAQDQALRVFRTEINRAHGIAYQRGVAAHPDTIGTRFLLSPQHPKPDICDLLSTQNIHGLGPGVYPHGKSPWPAHPNTLSYEEVVFRDEVSAADKAGKETPTAALARLSPAQRLGVLGPGKLALYEQGKLTVGMIRAPLGAAEQRAAANDARRPPAPPPKPVTRS